MRREAEIMRASLQPQQHKRERGLTKVLEQLQKPSAQFFV